MKTMKSIFVSLVCTVLFMSSFVTTVHADNQRVFDDARLFTQEEKELLETNISSMFLDSELDIVIVTTNYAKGKTSREYADDFYDANDFGKGNDASGVLLLIDMDNREAYISTTGLGISYLTDERIDTILDKVVSALSKQNYYQSAQYFLDELENYMVKGIPDNQYTVEEEKDPVTIVLESAFSAVCMGAVFYGITYLIVSFRYRKKAPKNKQQYKEKSRLHLITKVDTLINKNITTRHIPKATNHVSSGTSSRSSSSSGRSTTHSSSSGRSHGGGGREF